MKIKIQDGNDFSEYDSVLDALREERVFEISKAEGEDEFEFTEKCDDHFRITLNRHEVRQLAAELLAFIAQKIFCQNCGQPADHLTCFQGGNPGWRDMIGMNLCDKCLVNATSRLWSSCN